MYYVNGNGKEKRLHVHGLDLESSYAIDIDDGRMICLSASGNIKVGKLIKNKLVLKKSKDYPGMVISVSFFAVRSQHLRFSRFRIWFHVVLYMVQWPLTDCNHEKR